MGNVVGRETELERCRSVIDSAKKGRLARVLRIVGASGMGKTTLARAAVERAAADGWLVLEVPSFRIHATLPLFLARRVLAALTEALGADAARYQSGLAMDRERPEEFEEALLRLIEGVSLDYRLIFLLDDAQWADEASRTLIARIATTLADRPIVLLTTERSDEAPSAALPLVDEAIALGPLGMQSSIAIVRELYPQASAEVAQTIAQAARGLAIDLVAVATSAREHGAVTAADVSESARRVVTRDLTLLDPSLRTFLQICALIDEPIELRLLQQLWPQDELLGMIQRASGRYLTEANDGLRFVHASVLESVFETIPIEIPLRYRIIDAIKKLPALSLEDYERLAKQCAACGDRELERQTLLDLADVAASKNMTALATSAIERALAIREAQGTQIVQIYTRYTQLLNILGRELDVMRACRHALELASSAGITEGIGGIAASYVIALWLAGQTQEALAQLAHYESTLSAPVDQADLISTAGTMAVGLMDPALYERVTEQFSHLKSGSSPMPRIRIEVVHSMFNLRLGKESEALESMRRLESLSQQLPYIKNLRNTVNLFHTLLYRGAPAIDRAIETLEIAQSDPTFALFRPHAMLARGLAQDAVEFILERIGSVRDPLLRRGLTSALANAMTFRPESGNDRAWQLIEEEVWQFESHAQSSQLWSIAASWCARIAARTPKRARSILTQLARDIAQPPDYSVIFYPVTVALAAKALDERPVLEAIASGTGLWDAPQPWGQANRALASGIAAAHLKHERCDTLLEDAAERFTALNSPFFASYALAARASGDSAAHKPEPSAAVSNTTRREREIAALVAEGLTNRQIAEKLVLSERTVEGHIANLFGKVNVNSRTQLAAWYLRTASSVA